jgi:hypothetical protein
MSLRQVLVAAVGRERLLAREPGDQIGSARVLEPGQYQPEAQGMAFEALQQLADIFSSLRRLRRGLSLVQGCTRMGSL